jgi:hypothetical protein
LLGKEKVWSFGFGAYHHIGAGVVPGHVEFLDGTLEPAQVLCRAPRAGRVHDRKLVLPEAAGGDGQVRLVPLLRILEQWTQVILAAVELSDPAQLS